MKILNVIKPFNKDINVVGASWLACILMNKLQEIPDVELGLVSKLDDYSMFGNITIHEVTLKNRSENKDIIQKSLEIYKSENYDVMHIHIGSLGVIKWIDQLIPDDVNVVYTLHTSTMLGMSSINYGPYGKCLNNRKNIRIVAPSNYMQRVWRDFTGEYNEIDNLITIYNGIPYYSIDVLPMDRRNGKLVICGRLTISKNIYHSLQAVITNNIPAIYIGDDYETNEKGSQDYYKACEELLNNSPNIEWIKSLPNKEVVKILSEASCYLTMSDNESFGLTVAESLSVGTPVIYTDSGAVQEIMEGLNAGIHLQFVKRSKWINRYRIIGEAYNNIKEFDPMKIRGEFLNRYTSNIMADNYYNLYKEMLS